MADPTTEVRSALDEAALRALTKEVGATLATHEKHNADWWRTRAIALSVRATALLDSPILRAVGHPRFVSLTQQSTKPGKQEWAVIILPAHEARYKAQFAKTAEAACAAALKALEAKT